MRKKITKLIESSLPRMYDVDGEEMNKRRIADKVYDSIPGIERLDLEPFQVYVPFACSGCHYNQGRNIGCSYDLVGHKTHMEHEPPENCPLGHG